VVFFNLFGFLLPSSPKPHPNPQQQNIFVYSLFI
jgi:hypothetical protein